MTADKHLPGPIVPAQWDLYDDHPVERTKEEQARILAHLLVQLAVALNEKGKAGDGNA